MNKIGKFVTFDLTFTLIKVNGDVGLQYSRLLNKFNYQIEPKLAATNFRKYYKIYNKKYPVYGFFNGMTSKEWWKKIVKDVILEDALSKSIAAPNENQLEKMSDYAYNEFCRAECWMLYPQCRSTLNELVSRGIQLGLVSNFDERIHAIIRELDLAKYFNFVVTPHETNGLAKPNVEIFQHALKLSGMSSSNQITHIGNDIDEDYNAAIRAGFNAYLVSHDVNASTDDPRIEEIKKKGHLINNLNSLLKLIEL